MSYKCVTKCYYNGRLYQVGEVVTFDKSMRVPKHFVPYKPVAEQLKDAAAQGKGERLEDLNIFALKAMARAAGIDIPATATKEETIAAMRSE